MVAFNRRTNHNVYAKKLIAKKAVTLIKEGSIVFLDQSSTAMYLAHEIVNRSGITVVTNNIEIVSLFTGTAIKTICSGGTLSPDNRICLIGADAQYIFEHTYADIVFFSAKSISEDGLISDCTREEVVVRNSMLANAAKKVFLCDSEKFGTRSAYKQCCLTDVDYLISESDMAKNYQELSRSLVIM